MLNSESVQKIIQLALEEDLPGGDITSSLAIDSKKTGRAQLLAKERLVVCGLPLVEMILDTVGGSKCRLKTLVKDGATIKEGSTIATISGPLTTLLACERTILNFMQRLSGVATCTARICAAAKGITVLDTRKTTPGLRVLEKYAVLIGGGKNHRGNLSEMILIKNNHIDANGGDVTATLTRVMQGKPPYMPVEVEVRTIQELRAALPFDPQVIMLDNMNDVEISRALKVIVERNSRCDVEISGGVTIERLPKLKKLGVKIVSMGALTREANNVDIALHIEKSVNTRTKKKAQK